MLEPNKMQENKFNPKKLILNASTWNRTKFLATT